MPPIEILHVAFSHYPADTRVKRETEAVVGMGRRVAAIVLRGTSEPAVERVGRVLAIRAPGRKSRGGFFSYLRDYLAFTWRARRLIADHPRLRHLRIVHVHTLPDFLVWAALPARRRGARVVFDMHEIFPEFTRTRFDGFPGRVLERVARAVERWARRHADLTVTVNAPIDKLIADRPIGRPERRIVLHNSADPADFGEGPGPLSHGTPAGRPVQLVYHGTLTPLYGLDTAIRGVAECLRRGTRAQLTILGDGPERETLSTLASSLGLDPGTVRLEPPIPQGALPARLAACDAGLVPTRLDGMTRFSLSNKLLEYVHLGLPVLAARLPSYAHYFPEDAAWYWTPGDPNDLARAIIGFAGAPPAERRRRAERARESVDAISWTRERDRLRAAYTELLAQT